MRAHARCSLSLSNCSHFCSDHAQNTTRFTFHFSLFSSFSFPFLKSTETIQCFGRLLLLIQSDTHKIYTSCAQDNDTLANTHNVAAAVLLLSLNMFVDSAVAAAMVAAAAYDCARMPNRIISNSIRFLWRKNRDTLSNRAHKRKRKRKTNTKANRVEWSRVLYARCMYLYLSDYSVLCTKYH